MATISRNGTGITVQWSNGFLGEIINVTPPGATREMINCSHMSTVDAHEYIIAALVEWGEAVFEIAFDPGLTPPMNDDFELCTITFATGETWFFSAAASAFTPLAPMETRMTATVNLKVNGEPTMTQDSSGV